MSRGAVWIQDSTNLYMGPASLYRLITVKVNQQQIKGLFLGQIDLLCHILFLSLFHSKQRLCRPRLTPLVFLYFLQASSQSLFGADLDSEGPPTLTPEVPSDLFARSGSECVASSYSNMEEVD